MKGFARPGVYAPADRRLVARVVAGVALLAAVAITGPLISYRSDVAEVDRVFHSRLFREAHVYAGALGSHVAMLQSELERLAARPEINLSDDSLEPEQELLAFTHHNSALFSAVGVLDAHGHALWTEPRGALSETLPLEARGWFQRVLALRRPDVSALAEGSKRLVVAVPIVRSAGTMGMVVGLLDPGRSLPGTRPEGEVLDLVVTDKNGELLIPQAPPEWTKTERFPALLRELLAQVGGVTVTLNARPHYAAAAPVGTTGLVLMLAADEARIIAPMRQRFLNQLVFITVLQAATVLLFAVYLRRTYQAFLDMEVRVSQQEKMAALGSAASLIAHEVKNALNGLKAATSLVASGADPALPARSMRGQVDRLAHLASSLLHFGKPASAQWVTTELSQVVRDAVEGLQSLPEAEEVAVKTTLEEPLTVRCDPLLLATALDNLVRNAVEAAAVAKDLGQRTDPRVEVTARRSSPGEVQVSVEDNAGGPPAGFEETLFQPFVTGKPKGIGLGLSMARQAVEQQGGQLWFERTAEGSRFTIQLPTGNDESGRLTKEP